METAEADFPPMIDEAEGFLEIIESSYSKSVLKDVDVAEARIDKAKAETAVLADEAELNSRAGTATR
jgi:hypothetical protein